MLYKRPELRENPRPLAARYSLLAAPLAGAALALATAACGHPASREECDEIFRRSAELMLKNKNITDQTEVEKYIAEARDARGKAMLDDCLGNRITDKAMKCVRQAETAEQLDKCLQ